MKQKGFTPHLFAGKTQKDMRVTLKKGAGFTLIEILIGIALLAILLSLVIAAINPARRFSEARNTQRFSDVTAIMDAINLNMLANSGVWTCVSGPFPTTASTTAQQTMSNTGYNICGCIVTPGYIASVPVDPSTGSGGGQLTCGTYDTQYEIVQSTSTLVITVRAPDAELAETISISR